MALAEIHEQRRVIYDCKNSLDFSAKKKRKLNKSSVPTSERVLNSSQLQNIFSRNEEEQVDEVCEALGLCRQRGDLLLEGHEEDSRRQSDWVRNVPSYLE